MSTREPAKGRDGASSEFVLPTWFWFAAFGVGVVFLTGIRPFLRRVPDPPPVLGTFPFEVLAGSGVSAGGGWEVDEARGAEVVWLVELRGADPAPDEGLDALRGRTLRKLAIVYRQQRPDRLRLLTLSEAGSKGVVARARRDDLALVEWSHRALDADRWERLVESVQATWVDALRGEHAPDVGWRDAIVLVDSSGGIRGFYDPASAPVVSEVFHRSGHVLGLDAVR